MATAATPKITTLGTAVDLTDAVVNPIAAEPTTPRQGGFVMRNRMNFSQISTSNSRAMTVNNAAMTTLPAVPFYILNVPKRVYVRISPCLHLRMRLFLGLTLLRLLQQAYQIVI